MCDDYCECCREEPTETELAIWHRRELIREAVSAFKFYLAGIAGHILKPEAWVGVLDEHHKEPLQTLKTGYRRVPINGGDITFLPARGDWGVIGWFALFTRYKGPPVLTVKHCDMRKWVWAKDVIMIDAETIQKLLSHERKRRDG